MAARKKANKARSRRGKAKTELRPPATRDPGLVGNVGCWLIFASVLIIAGLIALFEFVL